MSCHRTGNTETSPGNASSICIQSIACYLTTGMNCTYRVNVTAADCTAMGVQSGSRNVPANNISTLSIQTVSGNGSANNGPATGINGSTGSKNLSSCCIDVAGTCVNGSPFCGNLSCMSTQISAGIHFKVSTGPLNASICIQCSRRIGTVTAACIYPVGVHLGSCTNRQSGSIYGYRIGPSFIDNQSICRIN